MTPLSNKTDLAAGLLFGLLGIVGIGLSLGYPIGSAGRMGPGYIPLVFSVGLALMAVVITVVALVKPAVRGGASDAANGWSARPLLCVLTGIVAFGLLVVPWGLIVSSLTLLGFCGLATRSVHWRKYALVSVVLTALVAVVFVYAIGVRIDLLPPGGR